MVSVNVSLTEEVKAFIEAEMTQNGYGSADEYFQALIAQERKRLAVR